jgi:hypothetical protein
MFATIKSLIPEPRQADQPRHYVGRHRQPETVSARAVVPAPAVPSSHESIPATAPDSPVSLASVASDSHDPGEPVEEPAA